MNQIKSFWSKGNTGKIVIILGVLGILCLCALLLFAAFAKSALPKSQGTDVLSTQTAQQPLSIPTNVPEITVTNTPVPTATSVPKPVILTGSGNSMLNLDKWNGPALLKVTHTGGGNFIVENLDSNGKRINLLIFTSGSYDGILPLDFLTGEKTMSFKVTANGSWKLQIIPLGGLKVAKIPGTVSGIDSDMFVLKGDGTADLLKVDASQASQHFIVYGIGNNTRKTLVDETAPYSGTVSLSSDIRALVVTAIGPWSLDVTAR